LKLLYSVCVIKNKITLNKFVEIKSTNAAKIFGLFPQKGTIAPGSDADIVIFDPNKQHTISVDTHHHNCDYSAYEGWKVKGKTETVILRGEIAIKNGELNIPKGYGKFLKRQKPYEYRISNTE